MISEAQFFNIGAAAVSFGFFAMAIFYAFKLRSAEAEVRRLDAAVDDLIDLLEPTAELYDGLAKLYQGIVGERIDLPTTARYIRGEDPTPELVISMQHDAEAAETIRDTIARILRWRKTHERNQ